MSEYRLYTALRFKLAVNIFNANEIYCLVKDVLGEPLELEYCSKWNGTEFKETDEVDYFSYGESVGCYNFVRDSSEDFFYIDYILSSQEAYDFDELTYSLADLKGIIDTTVSQFNGLVTDDCRLKIVSHYTGTDMYVDF